jgi:hypothetical protein
LAGLELKIASLGQPFFLALVAVPDLGSKKHYCQQSFQICNLGKSYCLRFILITAILVTGHVLHLPN